ncbi:MFS transporter [Bacteroidia bacterium]|nr:MFS transporter [Bacteroidia bacterium]
MLTFVNVLGFSILIPILPFVVKDHNAPTWIYGLLLTFYSAFQFLGSPYLGSLSDSLGRKPILLISQAGTLLSWFVFLVAGFIADIPIMGLALPIWIIGLSRILDGITGGNTSVTNAYVSDITNRDEKSYVFGYMGGIVGIGMIIGPAIGGLSASTSLGHTGTVLTAIGISIITLITITFWLKESLPPQKRKIRKKESFIDQFFILRRIKNEQPNAHIKLLFKVKFFFSMMMAFYIATIALFLIDTFRFDEKELGIFMFIIGIFLSFNQAFISRIFIRKLGEIKTLFIGLILTVIGIICITLTTNIYLFISFYYFLNLGLSLCFPTFNALISINSESNNQGEVMGISESIHSFCMASFPIIAAGLYGLIGFHLYYFIAVLPLIAVSIAYWGYKKLDKSLIK